MEGSLLKSKCDELLKYLPDLQCRKCKNVPGPEGEQRNRYYCINESHTLCEDHKAECPCGSKVEIKGFGSLLSAYTVRGILCYCTWTQWIDPNFCLLRTLNSLKIVPQTFWVQKITQFFIPSTNSWCFLRCLRDIYWYERTYQNFYLNLVSIQGWKTSNSCRCQAFGGFTLDV